MSRIYSVRIVAYYGCSGSERFFVFFYVVSFFILPLLLSIFGPPLHTAIITTKPLVFAAGLLPDSLSALVAGIYYNSIT